MTERRMISKFFCLVMLLMAAVCKLPSTEKQKIETETVRTNAIALMQSNPSAIAGTTKNLLRYCLLHGKQALCGQAEVMMLQEPVVNVQDKVISIAKR